MRIAQVDAFTDEPFSGNPAAVCLLSEAANASWMQDVAREMNLSETAFLVPGSYGEFDLRWFTPRIEVELCGHATLASAHVLWEDGHTSADTLSFRTRSGALGATRDSGWIELDFPARPAFATEVPDEIVDIIGGTPVVTARGNVGGGMSGYLLEYESEEEVRSVKPDFARLASIPDGYVIVTAPSSMDGYDFVSRFFGSPAGIDEDPVTGSAHCTLGPWWQAKLGKDELLGYQCSARGGTVRVRPLGDRVKLGGKAVTVFSGELHRRVRPGSSRTTRS
jgi:PhzF family phenazine biosynthesis protein